MRASHRLLVSRLLLALMLLTFLSPGFGWQAVAAHEQLAQGLAKAAASDHHARQPAGEPLAGEHDHGYGDAHTMIGHVLSHMPANFLLTVQVQVAPRGAVKHPKEPPLFLPRPPPDQPYRPPQLLLV